MKFALVITLLTTIASSASGKERVYVGSTPAHTVIRSFLGIPQSDSVDFIKWRLIISDDNYSLHCQFGIGQQNTDGFINGGVTLELTGKLRKENNYYFLQRGNRTLKLFALNRDLLHFVNKDNSLLLGNGGWSYTINAENPSNSDLVNIISKRGPLPDSVSFEGRTPCSIAGIHPIPGCIKLKWLLVLYANPKRNEPTIYYLNSTYNRQGRKYGTWKSLREEMEE